MAKKKAAGVETMRGDTSWFVRDRFGMFIHWGLYALAARHEWMQHAERVAPEDYEARYFKRFDPDLYDPDAWAAAAADAGMKYYVVTTKHHEGFCLWDTKLTDYKAPNTPAGRDLLAPMVKAFRKQGLRTGFYHSLLDWHHPEYIQDPHIGPFRDSELGGLATTIATSLGKLENAAEIRARRNKGRKQSRYAEYLYGQVKELLSNYGPVDILWFDFSYPKADGTGKGRADWDSDKLLALVRKLAPKAVLDDRLDLPYGWDVKTPEQAQPRGPVTVDGKPVVWEACQTFSGSWGYFRDEKDWRSTDELIRTLVDCVSKDGNLLLNVGPTGRGDFDERALSRLAGIGQWMRRHNRSIYGCGPAPAEFKTPQDCRLTYNAKTKRLYVHVFAWPYKHLHLDGAFLERVEYAQFLNDASEIKLGLDAWHQDQIGKNAGTLSLPLPQEKPNVAVPVIELFLK